MEKNGLVSMKDYPYAGSKRSCNRNARKMSQKVASKQLTIVNGDEAKMESLLASVGPVVIGMTATDKFMHYNGGIYFDQSCPNDCDARGVNHAMVLVGYGTDKTTYKQPVDYWLVKNSWGTTWGESGYIKMIRSFRGIENNCNVACFTFYATV